MKQTDYAETVQNVHRHEHDAAKALTDLYKEKNKLEKKKG
jgi:hypothetical protein